MNTFVAKSETLLGVALAPLDIVRQVGLVLGFSLLTAASAQVVIPMWPIPITGQTFAVLLTGALLVQSEPPGAAITVNGKPRAETTPATLTLAPGKYKVTLTKAGFAPSDFAATVMADAVREVSVGLAKSP